MAIQLEKELKPAVQNYRHTAQQLIPHLKYAPGIIFKSMGIRSSEDVGVIGWKFNPETRNYDPLEVVVEDSR